MPIGDVSQGVVIVPEDTCEWQRFGEVLRRCQCWNTSCVCFIKSRPTNVTPAATQVSNSVGRLSLCCEYALLLGSWSLTNLGLRGPACVNRLDEVCLKVPVALLWQQLVEVLLEQAVEFVVEFLFE